MRCIGLTLVGCSVTCQGLLESIWQPGFAGTTSAQAIVASPESQQHAKVPRAKETFCRSGRRGVSGNHQL
jgi:hypothetical protein